MQTGGALKGANTIPRRGRPGALLAGVAVLAIAALVALMLWVGPLGPGGVETRDVVPAAGPGTAVIHDDAGSVHTGLAPGYATVHDDAGNMPPQLYSPLRHDMVANPDAGTGSALIHDDAGNVNR